MTTPNIEDLIARNDNQRRDANVRHDVFLAADNIAALQSQAERIKTLEGQSIEVDKVLARENVRLRAQLDGMKDCLNLHEVAITAGRAALANAEPTGWQPIDTAPKNGSFYLAFGADGDMWTQNQPNGCYPGEWYFDENCAQWRGSTRPSKAASHWLPLPKDKP